MRIARENAVKAGVEDIVRFDEADVKKFRCQGEYGQIVTNPPYGERLLEKEGAEALYRVFGEVYHRVPPKWRGLTSFLRRCAPVWRFYPWVLPEVSAPAPIR